MEHLLLKAATTATDQGTFTAVISTASVDRDKDIIEPSAMVASLAKWAALGKLVPLAWNHTDEVVGHIDPATARIDGAEVIADGWVDREYKNPDGVERGKETWRLVRSGTLSFSFGFLFEPKRAEKLPSGRYRVKELDVFEISVVPVGPANNDTRVLTWKSLTEEAVTQELQDVKARLDKIETALESSKADETGKETKSRSVDPLRQQAESTALEFASGGLSLRKPPKKVEHPKPEPELPLADLKRRMRDEILTHLSGETP